MILHLDLDCFFVSAERTVDKKLLNIPVAVGGRSNLSIFDKSKQKRYISSNEGAFVSSILSSNSDKTPDEYFKDKDGRIRGIITTCSYEARKHGVKTAMSANEALRICPSLKMVPPNYPLYHELSTKLAKYLHSKAPYVEQFSIDEFFIDVTGWIEDEDIISYAKELQTEIEEKLDLPISIGISSAKWIAKLATEDAKPLGIYCVYKDKIDEYINNKPIEDFPGIGKGYSKKLRSYGIRTLGEIKSKRELLYSWKKPGIQLYNRVCGIDNEKLVAKGSKKSIGLGRTFDVIKSRDEIKRRLVILCRYLSFMVFKQKVIPQTYSLNIRYEFNIKSKSFYNTNRVFNENYFKQKVYELFLENDIHPTHGIIQLNITVSNFIENKKNTFDIFEYENDLKTKKLSDNVQKLRTKYGIDIIKSANEL